jgi:hypothetical protein
MSNRDMTKEHRQRVARTANERMQEAIDGQVPHGIVIPFLCECADIECLGRINMNASDYEGIHVDRDLFIVLRDHPTVEGDSVVGQEDGYNIVSKAAA